MTETIELISFPGTGNLPFFAGSEKAIYEARGINVNLETTPSSMYQAQHLVAGKFQLACTACDNVVAYQEGAGEVELDRKPDLFMIMGATQIEVSFVVAPEIETYEDVKGKSLALDALATGFAFALYRMLDNGGLSSSDYKMVSVGSTPAESPYRGESDAKTICCSRDHNGGDGAFRDPARHDRGAADHARISDAPFHVCPA